MKSFHLILIILVLVVAAFVGGYHFRGSTQTIVTKTVRDTIRDSIPYPVVEKVKEVVKEPFPQYINIKGDTIRDTIFINIPITQKEYRTDLYHAYVSGYKPSLDSITVYRTTEYITRTIEVKPRRFGVGVIGGYGVGVKGPSPFVGVGAFYRIW